MEDITQKLQIHNSGVQVPPPFKFFLQTYTDTQKCEAYNVNFEYVISLEYIIKVYCNNKLEKHVLRNSINSLAETLYGPLRTELLEIQRLIYEDEQESSMSRIEKLLKVISYR